jgi:hypothetical protein
MRMGKCGRAEMDWEMSSLRRCVGVAADKMS